VVKLNGRLDAHSSVGNETKWTPKGGGGRKAIGTIEDEVAVNTAPDYKVVLQLIRFHETNWDGSRHAYRFGYFTLTKYSKRIVWGQYALTLTEKNLRKLLAKARAKRWPGF
jgi:hypothetical protein